MILNEQIEEGIATLLRELTRAIKWGRPSILLSIYSSEITRAEIEGILSDGLNPLRQSIVHFEIKGEVDADIPRRLAEHSREELNSTVFFVSGLSRGGGRDGKKTYHSLNVRREYFVDHSIRIVFWITEKEAKLLPDWAPDFWAFRHRTVEFLAKKFSSAVSELSIQHFLTNDESSARVRVCYRSKKNDRKIVGEADFQFALSEEQKGIIKWYLEEYLLYPWGEFRNRARQVEAAIKGIGDNLFEAVFENKETGEPYSEAVKEIGDVRLVICANSPKGIAIPWELLRDCHYLNDKILAEVCHSFVRSQIEFPGKYREIGSNNAFNILIITSVTWAPDIPFQSVVRPLAELFREHQEKIKLDVLRPPTYERLKQVLLEKPGYYQVLHFEGDINVPLVEKTNQCNLSNYQGHFVFEDMKGGSQFVDGEELGRLLASHGVPVLVLSTCQSEDYETDAESKYPFIGNQLLGTGVAGVVVVPYRVSVSTTIRFLARFYQGLVNGEELSYSVKMARHQLIKDPQRSSPIGRIPLQDWMVPILFEASPLQLTAVEDKLQFDVNLYSDFPAERPVRTIAEIDVPLPSSFGFVGRDNVLLELERTFRHETIVLLEGMAGVGKTETAVGFARWWAETGALDGPIFFFRFEHYLSLAQVCDRVGEVFGPALRRNLEEAEWHLLDREQRHQVALAVLRQVPCIVIFDNFETVTSSSSAWRQDEQQELREFLAALRGGATRVLLTSRRDEAWLGTIYHKVTLGGLSLIEAQELAMRVLKGAGMDSGQIRALEQYNDLLHYLGGNPLAIQVILPELASRRPGELLDALQSGVAHLARDDKSLGRERSLAASLTYQLETLDPGLQRRLGILALFQGFVNAGVLALMCEAEGAPEQLHGLGREEWVALLEVAADVGLLRPQGGGYYTVHPALPWFFHELFQAAYPGYREWFEATFSRVYAGYGSDLDDLFKQNPQLAMGLLQNEEANLLFALRLAQQGGRWGEVGAGLYGIKRLFTIQGRWLAWERLVAGLEAEATGSDGEPLPGRDELWVSLLGHRVEIAMYRRDFSTAEGIYRRLKDHYQSAGSEKNMAVILHQLGVVAQERRQFDEAEGWYRQSLAIMERLGDEHGQAGILHQLGMVAQERRQIDEAEGWYRQSLAIMERLGDEYGQSSTLHQLGMVAQERRQFDEAEGWYRQSLASKECLGDEHGQALTLHQLGMVAQERRQFDDAERWYRQSLTIRERIGNEYGQAGSLHQLGNIAFYRRQFDEAKRWYRQSLAIMERLGDEHSQAVILHQLGRVAQEQRQWAQAESYYQQALQIYIETNDRDSQARSFHQLGIVAQGRRQWAQAESYYQQALQIYIEYNDRYSQASTYHQLGYAAQEQRQWAQAESYYQQALQIFIEYTDRYEQAVTYHNLGIVAQEQRQWAQAESYYQQALQIKIEYNDRYSQASTYHQLGMVAEGQEQWAEARAYYLQDLTISTEFHDDYGAAITLRSLARLWQAGGDPELPQAVAEVLMISPTEARQHLEAAG